MPNPYLEAALRAQQEKRRSNKASEGKAPTEKKAAQKSADNDNPPSKES